MNKHTCTQSILALQVAAQPTYYKAKEYNPETAVNPLLKPVGASKLISANNTFCL